MPRLQLPEALWANLDSVLHELADGDVVSAVIPVKVAPEIRAQPRSEPAHAAGEHGRDRGAAAAESPQVDRGDVL